jgi:hypothetical protein
MTVRIAWCGQELGYLGISVIGKNLPNWGVKWGMPVVE